MTQTAIAHETLSRATENQNAWIEIDLAAAAANVRALKATLGSVDLIAVVKANAYGAGAAILAPALEQAGADRFAVVWPHEGYMLR